MHVEVIRVGLGSAAAFAVLRGPGYRKLIVNTDPMDDRPLSDVERERGIAEWVQRLHGETDVPCQRETG